MIVSLLYVENGEFKANGGFLFIGMVKVYTDKSLVSARVNYDTII